MFRDRDLADPSAVNGNRRIRGARAVAFLAALAVAAACSGSSSKASPNAPHTVSRTTQFPEARPTTPVEMSPVDTEVVRQAHDISKEMYDRKNYPKGVLVPGLLNGSVKTIVRTPQGEHTGSYDNPVILKLGHGNRMDGAWIGVPGSDAQGHAVLVPVYLELGQNGDTTTSLDLNDPTRMVLTDVAVYTTDVSGDQPDAIMAFDVMGNGSFPSVEVRSTGMK